MRYKIPKVLTIALFLFIGLPQTSIAATSFLNIPPDLQDRPLTCEVATLKMALQYKGVSPMSENQLMAIIGVDARPRVNNIWADPNLVYVGNPSGVQNTSGYGVHSDPIARAAKVFLPNSQAFTGWSVQNLAAEIAAGNPVIIWGVYGRWPVRDSWITPEGKTVQAWRGEHTRLVIGFNGPVDSPTSFILNDPLTGRVTWSTSQLTNNWSAFGNAGVVIR